jgi:hypothetical protein
MSPHVRFAERNKQPGVYYAVTDDGLELPIVDVAHPAFATDSSAEQQAEMRRRFLTEQRRFARTPAWLRTLMLRFFLRGSRIAQGLRRAEGTFLDGMTTYLFKLGPKNLGGYSVPVDRRILQSLPAVSVRLRVHDMARLMSEALVTRLGKAESAPLWLINIAGGPAIDSLNTLRLLQARSPESIRARPVRILVLDADEHGPAFGARALAAWQRPGAPLAGLPVELERRPYDWRDTTTLARALADARSQAAIVAVSSEGGLFEYGTDAEIVGNLRTIAGGAPPSVFVAGSVTRDDEVIRTLKLTSTAATKPRGLGVFAELAAAAGFEIVSSVERPLSDQVVLVRKEHADMA